MMQLCYNRPKLHYANDAISAGVVQEEYECNHGGMPQYVRNTKLWPIFIYS
jgi:hypothetical protein